MAQVLRSEPINVNDASLPPKDYLCKVNFSNECGAPLAYIYTIIQHVLGHSNCEFFDHYD
jgi:hypothetical protein